MFVRLNKAAFWVQIYGFPPGYMSKMVGKQLGNYIGTFIDYDVNNKIGLFRDYKSILGFHRCPSPFMRGKVIKKPKGRLFPCYL